MSEQQPELWPCPRCQSRIPSTSTFCPNCGLQLGVQAPVHPSGIPATGEGWRSWSTAKKAAVGGLVAIVALVVLGALFGRPRPAGIADRIETPSPVTAVIPSPTESPGGESTLPTVAPATPTAVRPTTAPRAPATPPATAAAAPTSGGGVLGVPRAMGDYQIVTVEEAEYSSTGYQEFFEPDAGNLMYAFLLEFEGVDPGGSSYNPFYFKMLADGFEYSYAPFGNEPMLQSGDLQPGESVRGWVSFEAPEVERVTLVYEPVFGLAGEELQWNFNIVP